MCKLQLKGSSSIPVRAIREGWMAAQTYGFQCKVVPYFTHSQPNSRLGRGIKTLLISSQTSGAELIWDNRILGKYISNTGGGGGYRCSCAGGDDDDDDGHDDVSDLFLQFQSITFKKIQFHFPYFRSDR